MYPLELQAKDARKAMREYRVRKLRKNFFFRHFRETVLLIASMFYDMAEARKAQITMLLATGLPLVASQSFV